jgi:hypothetical protein
MVGNLSNKPKLYFVDDPGKLYRQSRRATQAKGLETLSSKAEVEGPLESPKESPPPSPKEDQPQPPPMGEQPQSERKIELCTPDVIDLPIMNLQDAERPFKIKVSTIRMVQHSPFTNWEALMRNFMKEFYLPTKTQSLCNKVDTFGQFPMETIAEALERFNEYMRVELLEWHIGTYEEDGEDGSSRPKGCRGKIHMQGV